MLRPIPEPCKVRVITIHQAFESALWSGFQKHLARENLKIPQILSGKSVEVDDKVWSDFPQDFVDRLRAAARLYDSLGIKWKIVSDDASNATGTIHPLLTVMASEGDISNEYCPDLDWIFRNTFCGEIHRPEMEQVFNSWFQHNGQCMGDRRSFPILCRIHYGAKRAFCRRYSLPPAFGINGDDGVIILPEYLIEEYFEFMNELWEINRLKTYVHDFVFSFNSRFYDFRNMSEVGIVRYSLIRGQDKFGEQSQDPRVWNQIQSSNKVVDEDKLFRQFAKFWKGRLCHLTKGGNNYFLPLCCGGLGLRPPRDRVWTTTKQQRLAISVADKKLERGVSQFETRTVGSSLPMTTVLNGRVIRTTSVRAVGEITTPSQLKVSWDEEQLLKPATLNGAVDYLPHLEETVERLRETRRSIQPFI
jgi:hypothetical protein